MASLSGEHENVYDKRYAAILEFKLLCKSPHRPKPINSKS